VVPTLREFSTAEIAQLAQLDRRTIQRLLSGRSYPRRAHRQSLTAIAAELATSSLAARGIETPRAALATLRLHREASSRRDAPAPSAARPQATHARPIVGRPARSAPTEHASTETEGVQREPPSSRRFTGTLNPAQLTVLQSVADGCPSDVMDGLLLAPHEKRDQAKSFLSSARAERARTDQVRRDVRDSLQLPSAPAGWDTPINWPQAERMRGLDRVLESLPEWQQIGPAGLSGGDRHGGRLSSERRERVHGAGGVRDRRWDDGAPTARHVHRSEIGRHRTSGKVIVCLGGRARDSRSARERAVGSRRFTNVNSKMRLSAP
jgi:hypothetical protein